MFSSDVPPKLRVQLFAIVAFNPIKWKPIQIFCCKKGGSIWRLWVLLGLKSYVPIFLLETSCPRKCKQNYFITKILKYCLS